MFEKIFLSVYILKSTISIGTFVTLIIGIALLFILVYTFIISSVTAQIQSTFRNVFISIFLISSIMMIISSISAIYGLLRKKNKFVGFYAFAIGLYFVSFLLLGIYSNDLPKQLQKQCDQNALSSSFQVAFNAANNTLCKQSCACYFPKFDQYTQAQQNRMKMMGVKNMTSDQTAPDCAEQCQSWSNITYGVTQQFLMIESYFSCAGWCNVNSQYNLYYLFSDINRGTPQKSCVVALIQFFNNFGVIIQITCFVVSIILFFILVTILCLCFHPQKDRQYDALKFFRETFVHKSDYEIKIQRSSEEGTQIFQFKDNKSLQKDQTYKKFK